MSNQLTAEQQRKIEENRRKALEKRAQRLGQAVSTNKQTSEGLSSTSVQIQPPKQSVAPYLAALPSDRDASSSVSAPKLFVPPPRKETQSFSSQNQGPKHQQSSGGGNQINQSALCNSRQVRFNVYFLFGRNTVCCFSWCPSLSVLVDTSYWPTSSDKSTREQHCLV